MLAKVFANDGVNRWIVASTPGSPKNSYITPRVAGFEGVALMDGMGAKGDSQIPGGFYAKVGHDLAEGGEHYVVGGTYQFVTPNVKFYFNYNEILRFEFHIIY